MSALAAAAIGDPALRESYDACRRLHARHGRTYYLATALLPPAVRPHVHALYGFARWADDIVDDTASPLSTWDKLTRLDALDRGLDSDLDDDRAANTVLPAVRHTIATFDLDRAWFTAFLQSMRMDLSVTDYPTFGDLMTYVHGSAEVIGLQMAALLGHPTVPRHIVSPYAADLGTAFQLANFCRDVAEDHRRGRVYLPSEDLEAHGVQRAELAGPVASPAVQSLLAFEVDRARSILRTARLGIRLLSADARPAIETATTLYGGILDEVEKAGYRVLDRRVRVGNLRRLQVAGPALLLSTGGRVVQRRLPAPG